MKLTLDQRKSVNRWKNVVNQSHLGKWACQSVNLFVDYGSQMCSDAIGWDNFFSKINIFYSPPPQFGDVKLSTQLFHRIIVSAYYYGIQSPWEAMYSVHIGQTVGFGQMVQGIGFWVVLGTWKHKEKDTLKFFVFI